MHPMPQLMPLLKQLRLSGIFDSLEMRNQQAIEKKPSYTDFLALIIKDEVARREQNRFAQRQRRANIHGAYCITLDGKSYRSPREEEQSENHPLSGSINPHIGGAIRVHIDTELLVSIKPILK